MKTFCFIAFISLLSQPLYAQQQFIEKGKIEFEKKTNLHKILEADDEDGNNSFIAAIKKQIPEVKTTYFNLYFDNNKTLYEPGREFDSGKKVPEWMDGPAEDNIVYNDLTAQKTTSQKTVFESVYNIQDSLRNATWKITSDTRTIAGFECRKATTTLMDSVFVFAFYTDQIVPRSGPESFTGLPGMILGIAIPRLHTTWFATKLELIDVKSEKLSPPKKGKKTDAASLKTTLHNSLKQWGKYGERYTWKIMI